MISWKSIISEYNDKPTLLEWLKKVQKALNESVLTTVTVTQEKAGRVNSITLSFNFQDGTKLVAPAFTVQDGKDGTGITDLIDTNLTERLVVTYDTTDGMHVYSTQRSTYLNGKHTNTLEFRLPIMPGNGIVIDKKENAEEVLIKIDSAIVALKSDLPPRTYKHLLRCLEYNEKEEYFISLYSTKNDAITSDYVINNPRCLVGAISAVLDDTAVIAYDRIITEVFAGPPGGFFGIGSGAPTPPTTYIKIISDSFGPV